MIPFLDCSFFDEGSKDDIEGNESDEFNEGGRGINPNQIMNLEQTSKDDLTCSVCLMIVWNPVCCQSCEAHFCKECISNWLENNLLCPACRCIYTERSIPRISRNILSRLKIVCKYEENGCMDVLNYQGLEGHEKTCEYQMTMCPNVGCEKRMTRKDLKEHSSLCDYYLCTCAWCNTSYIRADISTHETMCDLRDILCSNVGCDREIIQKDLEDHEENQCPYKLLPCAYCSFKFIRMSLEQHERVCDEKELACPGCSIVLKNGLLKVHIEECELIVIECEECYSKIRRKDLSSHDPLTCLRATVKILKSGHPNLQSGINGEKDSVIIKLKEELNTCRQEISLLRDEIRNMKFGSPEEFRNSNFKSQYPSSNHKTINMEKPTSSLNFLALKKVIALEEEGHFLPNENLRLLCMLALNDDLIILGNNMNKMSIHQISQNRELGSTILSSTFETRALCCFSFGDNSLSELYEYNFMSDYKKLSSLGFWLVSGHGSGDIYVWDLDFKGDKVDFERIANLDICKNKISSIVDLDDGNNFMFSTYGKDNEIHVWDCVLDCTAITIRKPHLDSISKLVLIEKGVRFASSSDDCTLKIWNLMKNGSGQIYSMNSIETFKLESPVWSIMYSAIKEKPCFYIALDNNKLQKWSLEGKKLLLETSCEGSGRIGEMALIENVKDGIYILALHKNMFATYDSQLKLLESIDDPAGEFRWGFLGSHIIQILSSKLWMKNESILRAAVLGQKNRKIAIMELRLSE